jgi:hypothetical protein
MGKTHSKPLAARHGRGRAWARHAMCESAFIGPVVTYDWEAWVLEGTVKEQVNGI